MSDEKKIEFSQSDVLNALLHQRNHEQHFATQDSVDNVKEHLARFEQQTDKRFSDVDNTIKEFKISVDKRFDNIDKRFDNVDKRFDELKTE
ncbi:hypothetical protein, partial [Vibrio alfacsensis]